MFVHADTEIRDSEHIGCGSPVRHQHLRSVPPVVTDESAVATAEAAAFVEYCPACDVRVEARKTSYKTVMP